MSKYVLLYDDCPGPEDCMHPNRRTWYLDRGISVPNLVAIAVVAVAAITRFVVVESAVSDLRAADVKMNADRQELKADLKAELAEVKALVKEIREDQKRRK